MSPPTAEPPSPRFVERFGSVFRRRDQRRWAAAYVNGLLAPGGKKTIEEIARRVAAQTPEAPTVDAIAQALQHFLDQSPWDDEALLRQLRADFIPRAPEGTLVVTELAFVKQGRQSVGVQRQYSATRGRKVNCQLAVALLHARADACHPLAIRLYLPRDWQEGPQRLAAAGVPEACRRGLNRPGVTCAVLSQLEGEEVPERALACAAGWADESITSAADRLGLKTLPKVPTALVGPIDETSAQLSRLGLDHFEGRSWRGFHHHASLVLLAHALRSGLLPQT